VDGKAFEDAARRVDPAFGRLICWMTFSAGVEFLGKGLCIANGIDFWSQVKPARTCDLPSQPIADWLRATAGRPELKEVPSYGTIGSLTWRQEGVESPGQETGKGLYGRAAG
jgi:hypothetical protein